MNHPTMLLPNPAHWPRIAGALRRVVAGARWLKNAYVEHRREARECAEFARLDDATLRDLGLARDEYLSYAAEARGLVPSTRLRIRDDRFRSATA
jgi:uncharacterized protein YjiS (DUF1127 family)